MIKKIVIGLSILIIISIIFFIVFHQNQNGSEEQISSLPVTYEEENEEEVNEQTQEQITQIIENQGLKADENIYEIATEYDGREVVVIKPNIQYQVALAGMLKKDKPEFSEINDLLEQAPNHTGIWIEEESREKFLAILKNITNAEYQINEEGFLIQNATWNSNKYDKQIKQMLSDEMLHIFTIHSVTYIVDEVTGEIQEYPFEEMDPYTEYEYFASDDKEMFIINTNSYEKIDQEEILKNIFE